MSSDDRQVNAFLAFAPAFEYMIDAAQRSVLSFDFYGSVGTFIANIVPRRSLTSLATVPSSCSMGAPSRGPRTIS